MQMIDVLKRLAELDATNPNVAKPTMTNETSLGTISNIAGETITENVNECGPMGMEGMSSMGAPRTPASFSINASAESGDEVSSMLRDIMNLAGVKPAGDEMPMAPHQEIELEPIHSAEMEPSAGDDMAKAISMIDQMNAPAEESGEQMDLVPGADLGAGDTEANSPVAAMADEVEDMTDQLKDLNGNETGGFDEATTTPDEKVQGHTYGDDQTTIGHQQAGAYKGPGNPNFAESVEVNSLSSQLLKAYQAFKNQ
jgi:hypothetical protein